MFIKVLKKISKNLIQNCWWLDCDSPECLSTALVPSLLIGSERITCLKYRLGNQNTFWHLIPTNAGISCSWATVSFSRETSLCIIKVTCVNLRLHPLRYGNDLSEESWLLHKTEKSRSHKLGSNWTSDCAKTKTSHTRFISLRLRSDTMTAHDVNCRR
jgi:hypothetical protein